MPCPHTRELLLEADPAELTGQVEGSLAVHLRECADCRAAAALMLAAERDLAAALDASSSDPDRAASRALAVARAGRSRSPWRRAVRWMPLAAAAALGLLLLGRDRQPPTPAPSRPSPRSQVPGPTSQVSFEVDVETPTGRTTAIFRTPNPDIVVVWFF